MKRLVESLLLILLGGLLYTSTGRDDSHITYWSAHTLANHGEILNYNGERIEQSSSMTLVVLLAALHELSGVDISLLGPLTSIFMGATAVLSTYSLGRRFDEDVGWSGALLTGASVYLVYWSFSGMETSLAALLSVVLIIVSSGYLISGRDVGLRRLLLTGTVVLPFYLVRPEMFLVLGCVLLGLFLILKLSGKSLIGNDSEAGDKVLSRTLPTLAGLAVILLMGVLAWRLVYFGKLLPQPTLAKMGAPLSLSVLRGGKYLLFNLAGLFGQWSKHLPFFAMLHLPIILAALYGAWTTIRQAAGSRTINVYEALSILYIAAYTSFIILGGGDWMEGGRFLAPMWPLVMLFAALGGTAVARKLDRPSRQVLAALLACQIALIAVFARTGSTGMPLWAALVQREKTREFAAANGFSWFDYTNRVNARDLPLTVEMRDVIKGISGKKSDRVVIASPQMGLVAYYVALEQFEQVHFLDLRGLIGDEFMSCPNLHDLPVSSSGTIMPTISYYELEEALLEKCAIPLSDVLFDLGSGDDLLEQIDFTRVFHHVINPYSNALLFPGIYVDPEEFIAVRDKYEENSDQ